MREFSSNGIRHVGRRLALASILAICLSSSLALAKTAKLPETVPAPVINMQAPDAEAEKLQTLPTETPDIPLPEAKPGEPDLPAPAPAESQSAPEKQDVLPEKEGEIPVPVEKPVENKPADTAPVEPAKPQAPPAPSDPRADDKPDPSGKLPAEEMACRASLKTLGVDFAEHLAESDPAGCSIPYPIVIKSLGTAFGLEPAAEMNCAMALASATFMKDVVSPAAKTELGSDLKSISHASAFVCRPRHGTVKLSEHAFGNAMDIATFKLADGQSIDVKPVPEPKAAKFLAKVRQAACGPFKTVLGPGSDPDHALHFHLDLAPRKNGGKFCQ